VGGQGEKRVGGRLVMTVDGEDRESEGGRGEGR